MQEIVPYFLVKDVRRTAEFYRDKLGFGFDRYFGNPPSFVMVRRGRVQLMFRQADIAQIPPPNRKGVSEGFDAYIYVTDVDGLEGELKAGGVRIVCPPTDEPHGCREMLIEDCDGRHLCLGQELA